MQIPDQAPTADEQVAIIRHMRDVWGEYESEQFAIALIALLLVDCDNLDEALEDFADDVVGIINGEGDSAEIEF